MLKVSYKNVKKGTEYLTIIKSSSSSWIVLSTPLPHNSLYSRTQPTKYLPFRGILLISRTEKVLYRKSTGKQQKLSTAGFQIVIYELDSSSSTVGKSEALYATEETGSLIMATVKLGLWPFTPQDWKFSSRLVSKDPIKKVSTGSGRDEAGSLPFPWHRKITKDVKCHMGNPLLTPVLTAVFRKMLTDFFMLSRSSPWTPVVWN